MCDDNRGDLARGRGHIPGPRFSPQTKQSCLGLGTEPTHSTRICFNVCVFLFTGGGNGNPLQYCCLENPMDGGAWRAMVRGFQRVGHD